MAIKTINDAQPNQRRPLQVSDLQDIWAALNEILGETHNYFLEDDADRQILRGFDTDGSLVFGGVYAQGGKLYMLTDDIPIGTDLYIHDVAVDNRTLENGDVIPFSFLKVINSTADGGTFAFTATREEILRLKGYFLSNDTVVGENIQNGTITNDKLHPSVGMSVGLKGFYTPTANPDTVVYDVNIVSLINWDAFRSGSQNVSDVFLPILLPYTLSIESLTIHTNPDFALAAQISGLSQQVCEDIYRNQLPSAFVLTIYRDNNDNTFQAQISTDVSVTSLRAGTPSYTTKNLRFNFPTIPSSGGTLSEVKGATSVLMTKIYQSFGRGTVVYSYVYIPAGLSCV